MRIARVGIALGLAGGVLAAYAGGPAAAAEMRWPAAACKPWAYTKTGGFHENEPEAWVTCKQGKGEELRLSLICHKSWISVRYYRAGKGKASTPSSVRRKITYAFPKRTYVDYARFEGALADWVFYRAKIALDHPIFADFQSSPSLVISLEGQKVVDHVPLSDPKKAVAQVLKACK